MAKVMMICTRLGKPIETGLDASSNVELDEFIGKKVECPLCGNAHQLKKLYLEGTEPSEKHRFNVALESAPDYAADLGIFISCFALVEGYMSKLLSKLIQCDDKDAYLIAGRFQMNEKIELLESLADLRDGDSSIGCAIKIFVPRLRRMKDLRNKYAHSQYSITFKDAVVVSSWVNDSKRKKRNTMDSKEDIRTIGLNVQEIQELICDLHGYIYRDEMPSA